MGSRGRGGHRLSRWLKVPRPPGDKMGERPQQALWHSLFSPLQASLCPFLSELTTQRTLGVPGHGGCEWGGSRGPEETVHSPSRRRLLGHPSSPPGPPCPGSTPSGMSLSTRGPRSPSLRGDANAAAPKDGERRRVWGPRRAHGKYNAKPIHLSSSYHELVFHL